MVMAPEVGSIIRLIMRSAVVLPLPEEPTNTVSFPLGMLRLSWSMAVVPSAKALLTLSKTIKSSPDWMVEAVVVYPVSRRLVGIDARVSRHRGVEAGDAGGGQLR